MLIAEEVKKIVRGEVYTDPKTLEKYSHDASIFEVRPALVVAPKSSDDIRALVKFANTAIDQNERVSLTARAAGTCMSGGSLNESIILDMTAHFNQIEEVTISPDKSGGYAIVEPGMYYRDFEVETKRRDLIMPSYPASRELATVGGMVNNNAGGEKTLTHGKVERYVRELRVMLSDGEEHNFHPIDNEDLQKKIAEETFEGKLYKQIYELISQNKALIDAARPNVTKNSAGYYLWNVWDPTANGGKGVFDLTKLLVGSQGTLGITTLITFDLIPVQPISKVITFHLKDLKNLGNIIVALRALAPESLESFDDKTFKLAVKFFPQFLKRMKKTSFFSLAWQFMPEVLKVLTGGVPKLLIITEFTGNQNAEVDARIAQAVEIAKQFGIRYYIPKDPKEAQKYWVMRRESFNLLREKIKNKHTAPFIDDFAVPAEVLPEFLPKLNEILGQYKLIYTIAGHPGDGNFHIIPLMDLHDQNQRAIIPKLSEEVYSLVLQYKGTITAEHNDGLVRTPFLEKMYGAEVVKLFEQVKKIFDPKNIFNPGKKVGGSMAYSMSHIRQNF